MMTAERFWVWVGGRRFFMAMLNLGVCAGLLYAGVLTDGTFLAINMATIGAYIAANVYQKRETINAEKEKDLAVTAANSTNTIVASPETTVGVVPEAPAIAGMDAVGAAR